MDLLSKNHAKDFPEIAHKIFSEYILKARFTDFDIVEIEFYLRNAEHFDQYVHCTPDQQTVGQWYFHKTPQGNFRGGTFKGLDITFGDGSFGGILIRSMTQDGQLIEGPCNCVDKILESCGYPDIKSMVDDFGDYNIFNNPVLKLEVVDKPFPPITVNTSRIGLSNKYPEFQTRPYRYISDLRVSKDTAGIAAALATKKDIPILTARKMIKEARSGI